MPRIKGSLTQQLQSLAHEYMATHGVDAIDLEAVALDAIRRGAYYRKPPTLVQQCKRDLARALRLEHYTDPQGREVRRMHPARVAVDEDGQYVMLWADILTARPRHMRVSMAQRRNAILDDCRRHKTDMDSYNDNNIYKAQLPLFDYNFNADLEEMDNPPEYPEKKPTD